MKSNSAAILLPAPVLCISVLDTLLGTVTGLMLLSSCRIRSFLRPDNAGVTAAEALTAPFFTYDQESGFFLDT